jgi:tetratricopeptide (TPR) repeat protein
MEKPLKNLEILLVKERLIEEAERLRDKSKYSESFALYKKALNLSIKEDYKDDVFRCFYSLGNLSRMLGKFNDAINFYDKAIDCAKELKMRLYEADASVGLGLSLRAIGNLRDSMRLIKSSKVVYKKYNDSEGLAFTTWAEAGIYRVKGEIIKSLERFKEARKIYRRIGDKQGEGYSLCGLGGASRVAGMFRKSLFYYSLANDVFKSLKDVFGEAYSYCGIGNAYRMLFKIKEALENLRKATKLYRRIGDKVSYAYTLWSIASTYLLLGDYKVSKEYYNEASELFRKTNDPRGKIYCYIGLGQLAYLNKKRNISISYVAKAKKDANNFGFLLESCHARVLLSLLEDKKIRLPSCYNQLGVKLRFNKLQINIP